MTTEFNPLEYVRQLEAAGVGPAQAEVQAGALSRTLVDVAFSRDLVRVEENLRQEMHHVEERPGMRIDLCKSELNARIDKVEARMTSLEHEMAIHRWVPGLILASNLGQLALLIRILAF